MLGHAPLGGAPLGAPLALGAGPPNLDIVMNEGVGVNATSPVSWHLGQTIAERAGFSPDAFLGTGIFAVAGDAMVCDDDYSFFIALLLTEVLRVSSETLANASPVGLVITEHVRFELNAIAARGLPILVAETAGFAQTLAAYYGMVVVDRLRLIDTMVPNQQGHVTLVELVRAVDQLLLGLPVTVADTVGITSTLLAQQSIRVLEAIQIAQTAQGAARYNITVAQLMRLTDSLAQFFGAEVVDGIGVDDALLGRALRAAGINEEVAIAEALTPQLLLHVTTNEGVNLQPDQLVQMLFQPTVAEGVEFTAGYVGPDGSFTTWSMNTRSGAVTEYDNFVFNSFAQFGSRYLGASDAGLYELLGDDDDGDSIVARVKGGFMQFGGTQLSRLKEAYIAARGEGRFVLKIRTADGTSYNYGVDTRNMRSTKVHMGKGQRSRYFAYELISEGQDFDLDTLEFVPIVVTRRV